MEEIWKDIEGYGGSYKISNKGRVKSLNRTIYKRGYPYNIKGKFIKQVFRKSKQENRYFGVGLYRDGKSKNYYVHRLVAKAFISNPENKPTVNHKDGDRFNNCVGNLEWATQQENIQHSWDNGMSTPHHKIKGENHPKSKLKKEDVLFIRKCAKTNEMNTLELSIKYNISTRHVNNLKKGKYWDECF